LTGGKARGTLFFVKANRENGRKDKSSLADVEEHIMILKKKKGGRKEERSIKNQKIRSLTSTPKTERRGKGVAGRKGG